MPNTASDCVNIPNGNANTNAAIKSGSQNSLLTLATNGSGVLDKESPSYVPGTKEFDYVIPNKKIKLGQKVNATNLGMFKLYAEVTPKNGDAIQRTVSFWMPEDATAAQQVGTFERLLTNGNLLVPVHWVFLYLHDNPDIEDAVLTFKSTSNSIYSALQKQVKAESELCTELRFVIGRQSIRNEKFKKTYWYPAFELVGRNYDYVDGKVKPVKGGLSAVELKVVLERSNAIQKAYMEAKLVARKHNIAGLVDGTETRTALPAGKGKYDDSGLEDGTVTF